MVVALRQAGIDASKARDERASDRWMVRVPTAVQVDAVHALERRGLPRPEVRGFDAFYPSDGLVPTSSEEQILLQYATSQELRRGLLTIDGVLDAQVNLVLPDSRRPRLSATTPERARASVVVKYDPSTEEPVNDTEVRSFIAGGVKGLALEDVTVLLTPARSVLKPLEDPQIVQIGPLSVPSTTKGMTQVVFASLIALILGLAAALAMVIIRRRR